MEKEFKVKMNTATAIFLIAYAIYVVITIFTQNVSTIITIIVFGVICYAFFLGCRPYKYTVDKKVLTIHYRLWKNSKVELMECDTICDPVPRWADLVTRPHAIEIYTNTKKRYCLFPVKRVEFVDSIVKANKRIHCTVKAYTDVHRQLERKQRKERRKAEKREAREKSQKESETD
ncbi:hypothetical protein [Candidatus Stoquefichus massiliensis]|uniref:hypothetical protein n=1 Tax=Candidatus Stoquefichus massiliensis TaxID=1470350 RepID=UPI0004823AAA|nr:hypothetical protein [Candidatus Stoquefichus massiliensis]